MSPHHLPHHISVVTVMAQHILSVVHVPCWSCSYFVTLTLPQKAFQF
jgi:hypothetical protein